jgi:hypothetical protein
MGTHDQAFHIKIPEVGTNGYGRDPENLAKTGYRILFPTSQQFENLFFP